MEPFAKSSYRFKSWQKVCNKEYRVSQKKRIFRILFEPQCTCLAQSQVAGTPCVWKLIFRSFLTKTNPDQAFPSHVHDKVLPHSTQLWLWFCSISTFFGHPVESQFLQFWKIGEMKLRGRMRKRWDRRDGKNWKDGRSRTSRRDWGYSTGVLMSTKKATLI